MKQRVFLTLGIVAMALTSACTERQSSSSASTIVPAEPVAVSAPEPAHAPGSASVQVRPQVIEVEKAPAHRSSGIALSPALALSQHVPLGSADSLGGLTYHIENRGASALPVTVAIQSPMSAGTAMWELGYEPLPDPQWITITPAISELAAGESRDVTLRVLVPNDQRWANRRFAACITLRPEHGAGVGAGLALAARLLLETAPSDAVSVIDSTSVLSAVPATTALQLRAGELTTVSVLVHRPMGDEPLAWKRLAEIEPEAVRRDRYRTFDTAEAAADMITVAAGGIAPPGAWQALQLAVHAPVRSDAPRFEEILVVGAPSELALAADPKRTRQPRVALVRCVVNLTPAAGH